MNGRVANVTPLPHRPFGRRHFRTFVLAGCCLMSLGLLGAVRVKDAFRPQPPATIESPAVVAEAEPEEMLATYRERAVRQLVTVTPEPKVPEVASARRTPLISVPRPPTLSPRTRQIMMEVTAYCACKKCCGPRAQGITASGKRVSFNGGRFVAADPKVLKFNTKLRIPGYANGQPVQVIDKGGAIKGNKLDVFFASHQEARQWGRQKLMVTVVED